MTLDGALTALGAFRAVQESVIKVRFLGQLSVDETASDRRVGDSVMRNRKRPDHGCSANSEVTGRMTPERWRRIEQLDHAALALDNSHRAIARRRS